ncbi:MAG: sigma-70 family RNA polymerase sigma factor [Oscillospiraceae bacterium]|nr:sigma-70 family RNA polymerase sigma factor [Oscillospiraceae bacterium]
MAIQSLRTDDCIDEALEKYSDTVYRIALTQMRSKHDAEDVFQDVFLSLVSKPRTFNDDEHMKAWLIRVTLNRCKSVKTSAWFRKTVSINDYEDSIIFEAKEEIDLFEYLKLLPQKYRSAIHLFYGEKLSVKQISKILNARESTVRTWLTRARAILREKLKGEYFNE